MKFNWMLAGHSRIVNYLQKVVVNKNINHAYLFCGRNGLGKSIVAKYFIGSLMCLSRETVPCGLCSNCRQIKKEIHPDIIFLRREEGKKNISVEQIREMRARMSRGSFLDSYKIAVIEEAGSLSIGASNAMLKILEEPLGRTIFLLIADKIDTLPKTVISRMQVLQFLTVPQAVIEEYLMRNGKSRESAYELARLSGGFPGTIFNDDDCKKVIDRKTKDREKMIDDLGQGLGERFAMAGNLTLQNKSEKTKLDIENFLNEAEIVIRDAVLVRNLCFDRASNVRLRQRLMDMAMKYDNLKLADILDKIGVARKYIAANINSRLVLENLLLEF